MLLLSHKGKSGATYLERERDRVEKGGKEGTGDSRWMREGGSYPHHGYAVLEGGQTRIYDDLNFGAGGEGEREGSREGRWRDSV